MRGMTGRVACRGWARLGIKNDREKAHDGTRWDSEGINDGFNEVVSKFSCVTYLR